VKGGSRYNDHFALKVENDNKDYNMEVNMPVPVPERGLKYGCWREWKKNTISNTGWEFQDLLPTMEETLM
jgi:hypothetical protein